MIKLERKKDEKWIFQKNISSKNLIEPYLKVVEEVKSLDKQTIKERLKDQKKYKGRSQKGSLSTMGVRFSQMCFYMFGYKANNSLFILTQTTTNILDHTREMSKNMLINLFSLQFPHPYSKTPDSFQIYAGRLIIKLLTEERINKRIYVDEFIWFLPFLKTIDELIYEELIASILEYRNFTYAQKMKLFRSVDNYENLFANCLHEINYYFAKIFHGFGVLNLVSDENHNSGMLFKFKHGVTQTYRTDRIPPKSKHSGYYELNESLLSSANLLLKQYSPFAQPITLKDPLVFSKADWLTDLYETSIINYLKVVFPDYSQQANIINSISEMQYMSKYSAVDGKDFENSLKPVFELFREVLNVEIISGSGDTDLLCSIENPKLGQGLENIYKINVDGKSRKSALNLNSPRLNRHLEKHNSKYCIVVAPRFSHGTVLDLANFPIVAITADVLAKYCSKECLANADSLADYSTINEIIENHLGEDITLLVEKITNKRYGIEI